MLKTTKVKAEWVIYKNNQPIGQAETWYKALGNLVSIEGINLLRINIVAGMVSIDTFDNNIYKIVKER